MYEPVQRASSPLRTILCSDGRVYYVNINMLTLATIETRVKTNDEQQSGSHHGTFINPVDVKSTSLLIDFYESSPERNVNADILAQVYVP